MFISKKMHNKIVSAKEDEIRELQRKIDRQEESQKDLREEIEKVLQEQDYNSVKNLKNKIRTILNKSYLTHMEAIR